MENAEEFTPGKKIRTWTPTFCDQEDQTEISEVEFVASYCWFNPDRDNGAPENPTIVIPGYIPSLKKHLELPLQTVADETECMDLNRTQLKHKDLLQPLFLSVKVSEPEFQFEEMDVICDSSKLRRLIEWCEKPKVFSIDAELLGDKTLVLYAFENKKDYNLHNVNSFRKDFHSQATSLPLGWEDTFGNYRIISYQYGDLKMLVRSPQFLRDKDENEGSELPKFFSKTQGSFNGLNYIKSGQIDSQEKLAKLQYTAPGKGLKFGNIWHKLYFSQIPLMFVARRGYAAGRKGYFVEVKTLTAASDFRRVTADARVQRNKLLQLLHEMRNILLEERENGHLKLTFKFSKGTGSVEVHTCNFPSQLEGWDSEITQTN